MGIIKWTEYSSKYLQTEYTYLIEYVNKRTIIFPDGRKTQSITEPVKDVRGKYRKLIDREKKLLRELSKVRSLMKLEIEKTNNKKRNK